jgi:putative glutamine amidotransferase
MAVARAYIDAVLRASGQPIVVDDVADPKAFLERVDAVVLTGGPDVDPARYGEERSETVYGVSRRADDFEIALTEAALNRGIPVLAICRGIQVLNVARGGSLYQNIPDDPGVAPHGLPGVVGGALEHTVALEAGSLTANVMGATWVTASCHHHQSLDRLGDGLRVVGRAADGIVEAVELDDDSFMLAVQWHPEDTAARDPAQQNLFDALVRAAP